MIEGLVAKIDALQSLTEELTQAVKAKDREILKVRAMAS